MNAPETPAPASAEPTPKTSSTRLLTLLGLLAVMIGALAYDRLYAGPGKDAAKDRIDQAVEAKVFKGVEDGADIKNKSQMLPTDKDIREAIGFDPKWSKKDGDYTLQCFHWWGPIPLNRNYLVVRFRGTEPLLFVDYADGETPKDKEPTSEGSAATVDPMSMTPGAGMGAPGKGEGKAGKGKAKGDDGEAKEAADAPSADAAPKADAPPGDAPEPKKEAAEEADKAASE
jgi:hypothetical protein